MRTSLVIAVAMLNASALADEPLRFPSEYPAHTLYATLDFERLDMIRQVYADDALLEAVEAGRPAPIGSVVTMPMYRVKRDEQGQLAKGPDGHLLRGEMFGIFVMAKRSSDRWDFASFSPDGKPEASRSTTVCVDCHGKQRAQDWLHTMPQLQALAKARLLTLERPLPAQGQDAPASEKPPSSAK